MIFTWSISLYNTLPAPERQESLLVSYILNLSGPWFSLYEVQTMTTLVLLSCGENQVDDLTEHLAQCLAWSSFKEKGSSYHYDLPCVI